MSLVYNTYAHTLYTFPNNSKSFDNNTFISGTNFLKGVIIAHTITNKTTTIANSANAIIPAFNDYGLETMFATG